MVAYNLGQTSIKPRGRDRITSILDIDFQNGLKLYVFPGVLSQNDIWIKFKDYNARGSHIRTPRHIHWTVDILIKKFGNRNLTDAYLNDMLVRWMQITPLPNRTMQTIRNNLVSCQFNHGT